MTGPDHQRLSEANLRTYCEVLARYGSKKGASEAIGCSTTTTWKWYNRSKADPKNPKFMILPDPLGDPDDVEQPFYLAADQAFAAWCDNDLRETFVRQATGYDDPVHFQGKQCWVQDTSGGIDTVKFDPLSGLPYWPPKLDPKTKQPIPLVIRKINTPILSQMGKAHLPEFREKAELDITSGGKPIFFPAKATSEEEFNRENGATTVDALKPDAS